MPPYRWLVTQVEEALESLKEKIQWKKDLDPEAYQIRCSRHQQI